MDAIEAFVGHVAKTRYEDLPEAAVQSAKVFILDTLGVGIGGSNEPRASELVAAQALTGEGRAARVWGHGQRLPAPAAALCNAYQTHCSEFDCVHEPAVVHAMTAVLAVGLTGAERMGGVSGRDLILAAVLGVDLAAGLGQASSTGLRFFRPATAGAFGATAALSKLMGLDHDAIRNAFSIAYGQVSGTMQAHTEGSMLLALQMGFNARNAVQACDLAAAGFDGPRNILQGPFGYFGLIERAGDPGAIAATLGDVWRVTELAHKPFPSGRATHGLMETCLEIRSRPGFNAKSIVSACAIVPPLIDHLVGRPWQADMTINTARLCARYVAARTLLYGGLSAGDFSPEAYREPAVAALAQMIEIEIHDVGDPNALVPIEIEITTKDGVRHTARVDTVLGNPAKPLSRAAQLDKFHTNVAGAHRPLARGDADRLVELIDHLEDVEDVTALIDLAAGGA